MKLRHLILAIACALPACAQPASDIAKPGEFNFDARREPIASLDGQWRFQLGDDPQWSAPDFDDRNWRMMETGRTWNEQSVPDKSGYAWYRGRVVVPEGAGDLSLLVPYVITSYQVFANGRLLGGGGAMSPHKHPVGQFRMYATYRLPAPDRVSHSIVLAFRVWHSPLWEGFISGEIYSGVRIGTTAAIDERKATYRIEVLWLHASDYCLALIELLAAVAALGFFLANRSRKEYLWFSFAILLIFAGTLLTAQHGSVQIDVRTYDLVQGVLSFAGTLALVSFFRVLLGASRGWFYRVVIASIAADFLLLVAMEIPQMAGSDWHFISIAAWNAAGTSLSVIPSIWIVATLLSRAAQGGFDARLLLTPVLLQQFSELTENLEWFFQFVAGRVPPIFHFFERITDWPFPISVPNVCDFLFLAGMLAIFVHRFQRTARTEDAHRHELESARSVQQVLVPEEIPAIDGFAVSAVFRPFGEVGGDFFQVARTQSGAALAIIGDVSGKGMPAAMTVSLLVGAFRTLTHYTQSPREILAAMNQRMLGRSSGGFSTALVVRLDSGGTLTAANAGHLPPYIDGVETKIENGLPLGLAADAAYPETGLLLPAGARLTLLTDGVVEARNAEGQLFGFERTAAISTHTADQIAEAAEQFGQEDDITVLTLQFAPAEVLRA